jgi:L-threonylcarbamoyladenylate synthase
MTPTIDGFADPDRAVVRAASCLLAGGVVVLPTDTVYGLAVRAEYRGGIVRLFALKERPSGVPVAVLVSDVDQADRIGRFSVADRAAATAFWPGPLTLVVRARSTTIERGLATVDSTIGVRCPDELLVRRLAEIVGPLATSSANRHGAPTPVAARDAASTLVAEPDLIIDGGPRSGHASTVASIGPPLVIHRAGALSEASLRAAEPS